MCIEIGFSQGVSAQNFQCTMSVNLDGDGDKAGQSFCKSKKTDCHRDLKRAPYIA